MYALPAMPQSFAEHHNMAVRSTPGAASDVAAPSPRGNGLGAQIAATMVPLEAMNAQFKTIHD